MNMSKMTKVQLIQLVQSKDVEIIGLRDALSIKHAELQCMHADVKYVDRRALMQRAAHLSQETHTMHRVSGAIIERYVGNGWQAV